MIDEKKLFEVIKEYSYPITQFDNSVDIGMTLAGIKQAIDDQPKIGGWISCSERLPEEPFGCLVTVIDTNPMTMEDFENILPYHVGYDGEQWNNEDGEQIPFDVIAWQPLPGAYHGQVD